MTNLNERERGFEAQFARDAEVQFRVAARRDHLFGLWAAARRGLNGDAAEAYARAVVKADLLDPAHEDAIAKVAADLAPHGVDAHAVRLAFAEHAETARRQIMEAM